MRLVQLSPDQEKEPVTLGRVEFSPQSPGKLEGAFRHLPLDQPLRLEPGYRYRLLLSTAAGEGDTFRDAAPFDGLSPRVHPHFAVIRSVLIREGDLANPRSLPAFADLDPSHDEFRLPVGPTLRMEGK